MRLFRFLIPLFVLLVLCSCGLRDQNVHGSPTVLPAQTEPASSSEQTTVGEESTDPYPATDSADTETDTNGPETTVASGAGRPTDIPTETEPRTEPVETEPVTGTRYAPKTMMYHLIMEEPYNSYSALFVRPSSFEKELKAMTEAS